MRDKTGTPIVEETIDEFYLWDFTDECHFFISKITDLTTNKKYGGIVAKTNAPNSTPIAKTSVQNPTLSALTADPPTSTLAYIDMDEIPALVNFFNRIVRHIIIRINTYSQDTVHVGNSGIITSMESFVLLFDIAE